MSIDFSKAPEGATHYMPTSEGVNWYCGVDGVTFLWRDSRWIASNVLLERPLVLRIAPRNDMPSRHNRPNGERDIPECPTGSKHDSGKPLMGAVPPNALLAVARVLTFGAEKYGRDNWRQVESAETRYLDAALRHINAYQRGEVADPESGESHLAHAVCSLMFMLEMQEGA